MIDIILPVNDAITMSFAGVAELADASDSKSDEDFPHKGSIPFSGIPPRPGEGHSRLRCSTIPLSW